MVNFSENLKKMRKEAGLSQAELARELNLADTSISAYELGKNEPSIDTLKSMSKLFKVTIDYLVGNELNEEQVPEIAELRRVTTHLSSEYAKQALFYIETLLKYQDEKE